MPETVERNVAAEEPLITLTELAAEKVRQYMAEDGLTDAVLRVSVIPGGCSGFEYGLNLDDTTREDDIAFTVHDIPIVIDPFSAQYLTGVSIDFTSSFQGSGFKFENPNATGSCGCGTSFAV